MGSIGLLMLGWIGFDALVVVMLVLRGGSAGQEHAPADDLVAYAAPRGEQPA